jgi:3-keto-5-aminohexanoate cleavage enzyme
MHELGIKPEMEIFDVSMVQNAVNLSAAGIAEIPLHFDFVMGLRGGATCNGRKPRAFEIQHP